MRTLPKVPSSLRIAVLGAAVLVATSGCNLFNDDIDTIDRGHFNGAVYSNTYFDFQIDVPGDYVIADDEALRVMMDSDEAWENSDSELVREAMEAAKVNSIDLFLASKFHLDELGEFNASIIGLGERIPPLAGIDGPADYLRHSKQLLELSEPSFRVHPGFEEFDISGHDFALMKVTAEFEGIRMRQEYYATMAKGFVLCFILTYDSDEEGDLLRTCVRSYRDLPEAVEAPAAPEPGTEPSAGATAADTNE